MSEQIKYAFYRGSSSFSAGDPVYGGKSKSDGMERKYFGNDLREGLKRCEAARKSGGEYRLDKLVYSRVCGQLKCKTYTVKKSPSLR